jgi:hypothetical protein
MNSEIVQIASRVTVINPRLVHFRHSYKQGIVVNEHIVGGYHTHHTMQE